MWCTECCSFLIQSSQSPPCNSPQHWNFSTQKDWGIHFPWFACLGKEQQSPLCSWKMDLKNWCGFGLLHTQALKVHPWYTTSPLPIEIESSGANMQRSTMPWHAWKAKTFHPCCLILCTLVWLIKSINEANTIPPETWCLYSQLFTQCHIS